MKDVGILFKLIIVAIGFIVDSIQIIKLIILFQQFDTGFGHILIDIGTDQDQIGICLDYYVIDEKIILNKGDSVVWQFFYCGLKIRNNLFSIAV